VSSPPRLDLDGEELRLEIPDDWDAVCRVDEGLAQEWQDVVRRAFLGLFARGYAAVDCVSLREGERRRALYVLRRDASSSPVAAGSDGSEDHSLHEPA
jgi:predicted GNAT superfamily acetyltransferase